MSSEEGKERSKFKNTVQNNYKGKYSYFKYVHTLIHGSCLLLKYIYTPCYMYTMPIPNTALHSQAGRETPFIVLSGLPHIALLMYCCFLQ